uniref:Uncharacterized protein n=2 Tax=Meloidogyne TaxID=189290 RepID=A0A6V7TIM9_MELEN|nr:unnamed protein product [Meloidogyne enterolobii]
MKATSSNNATTQKVNLQTNLKGNQLNIEICLKLQINLGKQSKQKMGAAQIAPSSIKNDKKEDKQIESCKMKKSKECLVPDESLIRNYKIFQCSIEEPVNHVIRAMTLEHAESCFENLQIQNLLIYYRLPDDWSSELTLELPLMIAYKDAFKDASKTKVAHLQVVDFSSAEPGKDEKLWSTYRIGSGCNEPYRICFESVERLLEYYGSLTTRIATNK